MAERWRLLRQATDMQLSREGFRSPLIAWGDENQRRGIWHRNLVLKWGRAAERCREILSELAPRYGFGYVDRHSLPGHGLAIGTYMAGYIAGSNGKKAGASIKEIAARSPSRRRVWWVSAALTKESRVTMTSLRNGRRMWAASEGLISRPTEGFAVCDWWVIDLETGAIVRAVWAREGEDNDHASQGEESTQETAVSWTEGVGVAVADRATAQVEGMTL